MTRGIRGMAAAAMPTPQPRGKEFSGKHLLAYKYETAAAVIKTAAAVFLQWQTKISRFVTRKAPS